MVSLRLVSLQKELQIQVCAHSIFTQYLYEHLLKKKSSKESLRFDHFFTVDVHNIQLKPGTSHIKIITEGLLGHYEALPFIHLFFQSKLKSSQLRGEKKKKNHIQNNLICLNKTAVLLNTALVSQKLLEIRNKSNE